ncbi:hypothetical protein [Tropicimonas sp. IMCC6043]|uniref:hypothetical protein n=1 Tax=Tropicimonas sp. IMCC6043 TaxID=2510645 RepID=UPI00101D9369|nr:hypothetical protein [Tropicimonas sp. IMCC6043]RYH07351.1 hypothetical protein EU800_20395 [Tropicimonas sp. IMCC6043]
MTRQASFEDAELQARIDAAARSSLDWLTAREQARGAGTPAGAMAFSPDHDVSRWPGMMLPGTYNGVICRHLLGGLDDRDAAEKRALADWIAGFATETGAFRIPGMDETNSFKKPDPDETRRYIDFHVTNYALGAIEALGVDPVAPAFLRHYLDPTCLKAWLADRDLRDPWQEGNNIVNLACFVLLARRTADAEDRATIETAIDILFDWHERLQEPTTGFWGIGQCLDARRLLHAMAGSMHNYHLYYACGRPLPYQEKAASYVLSRDPVWHSACIDVDEVDLLVHAAEAHPGLAPEVAPWLRTKLAALLSMQNADGGFADTLTETWRQDGWVDGYVEAPGVSTTFATWFRWIAIAMIDDFLWPGRRRWQFRRMIGIGYRRREEDNA